MSWSAAAKLFLNSFIPLGGSFPAQLLCWSVVSHLTWTAFSAKPRLGLVLITHSFFFSTGSASIFSCLWEGGGQISCEWKHRTDFCSTLTLHFDQRNREDLRLCLAELPAERRKDGSAVGIPKHYSLLLFRNTG